MTHSIYATAITKAELQNATLKTKDALLEAGFKPKLSKLQDAISQMVSQRNWSSLMSEWNGEDDIKVLQSEFVRFAEGSIEDEIKDSLDELLPLWTVELMDDGENVYEHYPGQYQPQPTYIEIDFEYKTISADYSGEVGNAVPFRVFHGICHRSPISPTLSSSGINEILLDEDFLRAVSETDRMGEIDWDGSNLIWKFKDGVDAEENRDIWIDLDILISDQCVDPSPLDTLCILDGDILEYQEEYILKLLLNGSNVEQVEDEIVHEYEEEFGQVDDSGFRGIFSDALEFDEFGSVLPSEIFDFYYKVEGDKLYKSDDKDDGFKELDDLAEENAFDGLNLTVGDLLKAPLVTD